MGGNTNFFLDELRTIEYASSHLKYYNENSFRLYNYALLSLYFIRENGYLFYHKIRTFINKLLMYTFSVSKRNQALFFFFKHKIKVGVINNTTVNTLNPIQCLTT